MSRLTYLVAVLSLCCGSAAYTQPLAPNEIERRAIYVENAMSSLTASGRFGTVFALAVMQHRAEEARRAGRPLTQTQLVDVFNQADAETRAIDRLADDRREFRLDTERAIGKSLIVIATSVRPGLGGALQSLAMEMVDWGARGLEAAWGPEAQRNAQSQRLGNLNYATVLGRQALADILQAAAVDPELKNAVDITISTRLNGVQVGASKDEILLANPDLASRVSAANTQALLQQLQASLQDGSATADEIRTLLETASTDLKAIASGNDAVSEALHALREGAAAAQGDDLKARERLGRIKDARAAIDLGATLIGFIDRDAGAYLHGQATAVLNAQEAIQTFLRPPPEGGSALRLLSSLVSVGSAMSLMLGGGQDMSLMILEEVRKVRRDLVAIRKEMHSRFDAVDEKLNLMYDDMLSAFSNLERAIIRGNADIKRSVDELANDIGDVRNRLASIEATLADFDRDIFSYLQDEARRQVITDRARCIDAEVDAGAESMDERKYRECLAIVKTWAVNHSISALAVGAAKRDTSRGALARELSRYPLMSNIGYIASVLSREFAHWPAAELVKVGNPLVWALAAEAYVDLLKDRPTLAKDVAGAGLKDIAIRGRQFERITGALLEPSLDVRQEEGAWGAVSLVLSAYKEEEVRYFEVAKTYIDQHVSNRLSGGVDVSAGTDQKTDYRLSTAHMEPCDQDWRENGVRPRVPLPSMLKKFLEPHAVLAEQLELGTIQACFDLKPDTKTSMHLRMRVLMAMQSGASLPLMERTIVVEGSLDDRDKLVRNWDAAGLDEAFLSPLWPGSWKRERAAGLHAEVRAELERRASAALASLLNESTGRGVVGEATRRLDGMQKLLNAVVSLALPMDLTTSDALRASVVGQKRLLGAEELSSMIESTEVAPTLRLEHIRATSIANREQLVSALVGDVAGAIGRNGGGLVASIMHRVELEVWTRDQMQRPAPVH